jgi:hypothetical protein
VDIEQAEKAKQPGLSAPKACRKNKAVKSVKKAGLQEKQHKESADDGNASQHDNDDDEDEVSTRGILFVGTHWTKHAA